MVSTNSTGNTTIKKKQTQGRKKIEIKKIEETNSRQVTFSKRRTGLFKKASELCVLTGAEIAILVNSPGGKVYSFGHPNADVLIDRYLDSINQDHTNNVKNNITPMSLPTNEFINQHFVDDEDNIDGMNVMELEEYLFSLIELKKKVVARAHELTIIKNSTPAMLGCSDD